MSQLTALVAQSAKDPIGSWLGAALKGWNVGLKTFDLDAFSQKLRDANNSDDAADAALADLPPYQSLILAPYLQSEAAFGKNIETASDILTACFSLTKASLARYQQDSINGRIFALLEVDAVMGDPMSPANSAIAGGMLSLFRTVALELKKSQSTVNALIYSRSQVTTDTASGVATLLNALCSPEARSINGQEIYAVGAADVGRLHP